MESIRHVLADYTMAKLFWEQTKATMGIKLPRPDTSNWAEDLLFARSCDEKERAMIIIGMYALWSLRNKRRHGEQMTPIKLAVQWVGETAYDLWQLSHPIMQAAPRKVNQTWKLPSGWVKCNVDGAFYAAQRQGATGVALRNHRGTFSPLSPSGSPDFFVVICSLAMNSASQWNSNLCMTVPPGF